MSEYHDIKDKANRMAYDAMMEKFGDSDLQTIVDIMEKNPYASFGLVRGLSQQDVARLFPLVSDGSWRVKEAYYCSEYAFNITMHQIPRFVDVESYKEWTRLKEKYPKGFDCYEGGREAWDEYNKNWPDFWGDARMFDGNAEFRFGKCDTAPRIFDNQVHNYSNHESIKKDELFLVIYEDSGLNSVRPNPDYAVCYVLTPNKDTMEERKLEIYKYFKSHIVSAYLPLVEHKRDEEEANRLRDELLSVSDRMMASESDGHAKEKSRICIN